MTHQCGRVCVTKCLKNFFLLYSIIVFQSERHQNYSMCQQYKTLASMTFFYLVLWCPDRLLASHPQQFIDSRVQAERQEDSLLPGNGHPNKGLFPILIVKLETGYSLSVANLPASHASQRVLPTLLQTEALC